MKQLQLQMARGENWEPQDNEDRERQHAEDVQWLINNGFTIIKAHK